MSDLRQTDVFTGTGPTLKQLHEVIDFVDPTKEYLFTKYKEKIGQISNSQRTAEFKNVAGSSKCPPFHTRDYKHLRDFNHVTGKVGINDYLVKHAEFPKKCQLTVIGGPMNRVLETEKVKPNDCSLRNDKSFVRLRSDFKLKKHFVEIMDEGDFSRSFEMTRLVPAFSFNQIPGSDYEYPIERTTNSDCGPGTLRSLHAMKMVASNDDMTQVAILANNQSDIFVKNMAKFVGAKNNKLKNEIDRECDNCYSWNAMSIKRYVNQAKRDDYSGGSFFPMS